MPLFENAADLMRTNLEQFQATLKIRVPTVAIGSLTDVQLSAINENRAKERLPPIVAEVLFVGWHIYKSRVLRDGYRIADVIDQMQSAMSEVAVVLDLEHMTAMETPVGRADAYGNIVRDRVVFECTARHPRPELFGNTEGRSDQTTQIEGATFAGDPKIKRLARVTTSSGCTSRLVKVSTRPGPLSRTL